MGLEAVPALRGLGRSLSADLLGMPVDAATDVINLLRAGVGYVGHKTGLLKEPLSLIDKKDAVGSSDWFAKGTPLAQKQGESEGSYELGRLAPAIASLPTAVGAALAPERAAKTVQALRKAPKQAGALYPGGSDDLVAYHGTELGHGDSFPRELINPSFAISSREPGSAVNGSYGNNFLIPKPQAIEPRETPTFIKAMDTYTPRKNVARANEFNRDPKTAIYTDQGAAAAYRQALGQRMSAGDDYSTANEAGLDAARRLYAQNRVADRSLPPLGGQYMEGMSINNVDPTQLVSDVLAMRTKPHEVSDLGAPSFGSLKEFAESPLGAGRLAKNLRDVDEHGFAYTYALSKLMAERGLQSLGANPNKNVDPEWLLRNVRSSKGPLNPAEAQDLAMTLRDLRKTTLDNAPTLYAEAKRYGSMGLHGDNFAGLIINDADPAQIERARAFYAKSNLPVFNGTALGLKDRSKLHQFMADLQTQALRGAR